MDNRLVVVQEMEMDKEKTPCWNQELYQLIQCRSCKKMGEQLKQLTCQHVICVKCANNIFQTDLSLQNIKCPECFQGTPVTCGIEQLPDSLMANKLADIIQNFEKPDTPIQPPTANSIVLDKLNSIIARQTKNGQLQRTVEEKIKETHNLIKIVDSNEKHVTELKERIPAEFEQTRNRMEELQAREGQALKKKLADVKAASAKKIRAIERSKEEQEISLRSAIEQTEPKIEKLRQMIDTAEDMLDRLNTDEVGDDLGDFTTTLEELRSFKVKTFNCNEALKPGDSVRLKIESPLMESVSQLMEENINFHLIGRVISVESRIHYHEDDGSSSVSVWFSAKELWKGTSKQLVKSFTPSNLPYVGDRVVLNKKVMKADKYGVTTAQLDNWYNQRISGTVLKIGKSYQHSMEARVIFPGQCLVDTNANHLERIGTCRYQQGMEVMLRRGLTNPVRGFSGVTRSSFGVVVSASGDDDDDDITVDFPECTGWQGKISEVQVARYPMVGEHAQPNVRVNLSESKWNNVTSDDYCKVIEITHRFTKARVRFGTTLVNCLLKELDLAEPTEDVAIDDSAQRLFTQYMLRQAIAGIYHDPLGYGVDTWNEEDSDDGFLS